jgi:hypothetical protein
MFRKQLDGPTCPPLSGACGQGMSKIDQTAGCELWHTSVRPN